MELCTKGLGSSVQQLKSRGVSLACVRTCVVVAEERPRINLSTSFSKLFSALGLSPRAVSTSFGCRVNVAICLQVRECDKLLICFTIFVIAIVIIISINIETIIVHQYVKCCDPSGGANETGAPVSYTHLSPHNRTLNIFLVVLNLLSQRTL